MRSSLMGMMVNAALAIFKGVSGIVGNSYALVADGVESMSDVVSSAIVWGGLKIASTPPDESHPYGHGKAEPLAAMIVSMALFGAAIGIAIQSIREIRSPHGAPAPFTLVVLVVVILVKEGLFRYVFDVGRDIQSTAVKTDAWHHRSDAITSLAAFVGISIALIGGPGYEMADDWAALAASGIIAWNGYRLLRPALEEVMDAAPPREMEHDIRTVASGVDGVVGLEKCFIRKMGLDYYVDLHVLVDGDLTVRESHEIAHNVKDALRRSNPRISDALIHVEPEDAEHEPRH